MAIILSMTRLGSEKTDDHADDSSTISEKSICRLFHILAQFLFTPSGTRLLSPESKYTSFLTSYQITYDLRS